SGSAMIRGRTLSPHRVTYRPKRSPGHWRALRPTPFLITYIERRGGRIGSYTRYGRGTRTGAQGVRRDARPTAFHQPDGQTPWQINVLLSLTVPRPGSRRPPSSS